MMKKFLLAAVFVIVSGSFGAVYLDEGFESGTLDNVTVTDVDGDTNNWQAAVIPVKAGTYWAESVSSGLTPDNEMLFPSTWMEIDAYLNFWVGGTNTDSPEHFEIYIANDRIDPSNFILVHEETLNANTLKNVEISLRDYFLQLDEWFAEGEISVKVRHYNENANGAGSALVIDDFRIIYYPTFSYDEYYFIIPDEVVEPYKAVSMRWAPYDRTAYDGDWIFVGFDNIALHYIITDGDGIHPEETFPLVVNTDLDYEGTYLCDFPGQPMGSTMEYWVEAIDNSGYDLVGESQHFNVEWGEINFGEGFETGDLPEDWVTYQTGTVTSTWDRAWEVDVAAQNVHTGTYSITSAAQNNFGVWLTENYLVTPRLRVNGKPTLKYFVNAQTKAGDEFVERWSLLISTVEGDGTDIENFVEIVTDSIIPTDDNLETWYEKLFPMDDYQDQYVRIMWKHRYTSTETKLDRFLNIDDVSIAEMPKISVQDPGNAAYPGDDFPITVTATDYSGIDNVTIYYSLNGGEELSVVMTANGDDTFTGAIPGQTEDTRCSWYAVVTDNSMFSNTTTTSNYSVIWFNSGILEWGSIGTAYGDYPESINAGNKIAIDWNFGTKGVLYLNMITVGLSSEAADLKWKLVEFDPAIGNLDINDEPIGAPTDIIIGDLQGTNTFTANGDSLLLEGNKTPIYGHVALVFDFDQPNEIMLDESGDKSHAWQWNSVSNWTTNDWGAFYIKMYVSQTVGIEGEFVSSTTELCQNYPNPFNPVTSISFYNRIAGNVKLTVYNTKGEIVATLLDQNMNEGFRKVDFDASRFNSGVYYYTLNAPEKTLTRKMVLVK